MSSKPKRKDRDPKKWANHESRERKHRAVDEEARERLLAAGWEPRLRAGLLVWRKPGGRGSWYSQDVALELLEFLAEEEKQGEERP